MDDHCFNLEYIIIVSSFFPRNIEFEGRVLDCLEDLKCIDRNDTWSMYEIGDLLTNHLPLADIVRLQGIFASKYGLSGRFTGLIVSELQKIFNRLQRISERQRMTNQEPPRY